MTQPCAVCAAPAVPGPDPDLPLCERCEAIARDIATQKAFVVVQTLRRLKAEYTESEAA